MQGGVAGVHGRLVGRADGGAVVVQQDHPLVDGPSCAALYPCLVTAAERPPFGGVAGRQPRGVETRRPARSGSASRLRAVVAGAPERYGPRRVARSSAVVIGEYSTSFGLAIRTAAAPHDARHIRNVYALVRLADEVVDGVAAAAGVDPTSVAAALDDARGRDLPARWRAATRTNLVVHAFATTARARRASAGRSSRPFFTSMRMDLQRTRRTRTRPSPTYVYGSAEVVGLMCLRAFLAEGPPRRRAARGARDRRPAARRRVPEGQLPARPGRGRGRPGARLLPRRRRRRARRGRPRTRSSTTSTRDLAAAAATLPLLPRGTAPGRARSRTGCSPSSPTRIRRDARAETLRTDAACRVPDPVEGCGSRRSPSLGPPAEDER